MKKLLKRLLDAMAKAKTNEEREALFDLIEKLRDDQDAVLPDDLADLEKNLGSLGL